MEIAVKKRIMFGSLRLVMGIFKTFCHVYIMFSGFCFLGKHWVPCWGVLFMGVYILNAIHSQKGMSQPLCYCCFVEK